MLLFGSFFNFYFLTRFEYYRVLSVRICDMDSSIAIIYQVAEFLGYSKSLSKSFFDPAGMKSD